MTNAEIATNLLTYITKYVSYDSDTKTVNVDLQSFVNNAQPQLATVRAAFTSAVTSTYDGADAYTLNSAEELAAAVAVVGEPIDRMLQTIAGVSAADLLGNAQAVGQLLAYYIVQWRTAENYDPVGGLLDQMIALLEADSQEAIAANINQAIIMPFIQTRGIQTVADQLAKGFADGNIDLTSGLVLLPALTDMIDDDSRANIREIIGIITNTLKNQILADGNDAAPNRFNIAVNSGTLAFNPNILSVYITDIDALGTSSLQPIDASEDTVGAFRVLVAGNLDGSEGESLIGSGGNDIILVGGDDSVYSGDGNDLIVIEDGNSTVETGTVTDPATGFEYTTVTGSIYEDNHTRQAIGISSVSSATVVGFEQGWSDANDVISLVDGDIYKLTFNFGTGALTVIDNTGFLALGDSSSDTVSRNILLSDGDRLSKATAISENQTIVAGDADRYYLPQGSMLTGVNGNVIIDDCLFSTNGNLSVEGGTYTYADGTSYWFAATAYGLSAGDTVSINDLWSNQTDAPVYRVSDDGTQIIRDADGAVVYEGDASTLGALNFGAITGADYNGGQIATAVNTFIDKYITFDGNNLVIDAEQLQSDLRSGIENYRDDLSTADADVALQRLSAVIDEMFGINMTLEYLLSESVIDGMKSRISTAIDGGSTAYNALIGDLDQYGGGVGLRNWIIDKVFTPLQSALGLQNFSNGFADIVDGEGNLHLSRWIANAQPLLSDMFSDELTSKVLATNLDAIGNNILAKLRADSGGTLDGHADIIFDGDDSVGLGLFLTPVDAVGSSVGNVIDASASTIENNIIVSNLNDSIGEVIVGSVGRDMIMVGAGDTVNGNGGDDLIILADGETDSTGVFVDNHSRQLVGVSSIGSASVVGFEAGFALDNGSPDELFVVDGDIDDLAVHFGDGGLTVNNRDGSMLFADIDNTVRAELIVDGEKFIALNGGNSVEKADDVNHYWLEDGATITAEVGGFTVNGFNIFAELRDNDTIGNYTIVGGTPVADYERALINLSFGYRGSVRSYEAHAVVDGTVIDSLAADNEALTFDGDATIEHFTGTAHLNELTFSTAGDVRVLMTEGSPLHNEYKSIHSITGVKAGETFLIGISTSGLVVFKNYSVSDDGTTITRTDGDDSTVVWRGTAEELATLNVMNIYAADVLETKLLALIEPMRSFMSFDGDTVNIDGAGIRSAISTRLNEMKSQLVSIENPTADDVIAMLDAALDNQVGLTLEDIFSTNTLDNLKARLNDAIANNTDIVEGIFNSIVGDGISPFLYKNIINPIINQLGAQISAQDISKIVSDGDSVSERLMLNTIFDQIFATERATEIANKVWNDFKTRIETELRADSNSAEHMNVVVSGSSDTLDFGIYVANSGGTIDASNAPFGTNWIFNALDNTVGTYIVGSPYRDMIFADGNDTIYSGAGIDDRIILSSGSGTINVNDEIPATVTGIADAFNAYIDSAVFDDAHTREYIGLSSISSTKAFGFEVGWSLNGSNDGLTDVLYLVDGDITDLSFEFGADLIVRNGSGTMMLVGDNTVEGANVVSNSQVPSSTVRADLLIQNAAGNILKAAAVNEGQVASIDSADVYFANNATLLSSDGSDASIVGENVSVVEVIGGSSISLDANHTRDFVELSADATINGFETGFGDDNDVLIITDDELTLADWSNWRDVTDGGSANILVADSDLSISKVTAVDDNQSIAATTDADVYWLNDGSTLTGFTGSAVVQNNLISTNGTLDVVVRYNERHDINWVDDIVGLSAGDTISIADADGSNNTDYSVSADGTTITRLDTGAVIWSGTADELAAVDMQDLDYIEFYSDNLANTIYTVLTRYVTFDGDTLTIDGATLRTNVAARLAAARAQMGENATADDVIERLEGIISNVFGDELVIGDILNDSAIERLKAQFTEWIAAGIDPFTMLGAQLDTALGEDGLLNFMRGAFVQAAAAERGIQAAAVGVTDIYNADGNISLTTQLRAIIPSIGSILTDDMITEYFRRGLDRIARTMLSRVSAENGDDNYINIVLTGTNGTSHLGLYFTKLSEIGSGSLQPIDASASTIENNLIIGNIAGSNDETITGSAQRDVILVGDGDTVNGMGGGDLIIFADGDVEMTLAQSLTAANFLSSYVEAAEFSDAHTQQVIALDSLSSATVVGFETGWSIDGGAVDLLTVSPNEFYELNVKFIFDDDGLTISDSDGSLFLASNDAAVFPTVNPNAVSDSRTPSSTVRADLLINDQRVTAVNDNQSIEASGADRYILNGGATLTGFTGTAVVNDYTITSNSPLNIIGAERSNGWRVVGQIYGLRAGESITVALSDGTAPTTYTANADGTAIIREDNGKTVWTGTAEELAALDFVTIDYQEYYGDILTARIEHYLQQYVVIDNGTMTIDLASMQSNLEARLAAVNERIAAHDEVTADVVYEEVLAELNDITGITLKDYLSVTILEALRNRIETDLAGDSTLLANFVDNINPDGVSNFLKRHMANIVGSLGVQNAANDMSDFLENDGSLIETLGLDPLLNQIFSTRSARRMIHNIVDDYRQRFLDDVTQGIVLNGDENTIRAGLFRPTDAVLDISTVDNDHNLIVANGDSLGQSIVGSDRRDVILAGDGDTVNGGAGNDFIVFADGNTSIDTQWNLNTVSADGSYLESMIAASFDDEHTRQVVEIGTDTTATVVGFEIGFDDGTVKSDVLSVNDVNDIKFKFDDNGLTVIDTGSDWDADGRLFLASDDAAVLSSVSSLSTTGTRTPQPSVNNEILVSDVDGLQRARVYVGGQSLTAGDDVDIHYITDNSTVNATTATEIVNGGSNVLINGSNGEDYIYSNLAVGTVEGNVTINGGAGDDYIEAGGGSNVLINGGAGDDAIINWSGRNATLNADEGADGIAIHDGTNELINAGAGDDFIWSDNETNSTIDGGAGNDLISITGGSNVIMLRAGEGADTIVGLSADYTVSIDGSYSTVAGTVSMRIDMKDGGSMMLYGAASLDNVNIIGGTFDTDTGSGGDDTGSGGNADTLIAAGLVEYTLHKVDSLSAPSLAAEYFHNDYDYDWQPTLSIGSETWTIQSSDELSLNAVHYQPAESSGKWVVLVHGYGGNHTTMREFVDNYLAVGYDVLAIDQRAAGDSQGEWLTMGAAEASDVAAWTREIARREPSSKITLHGVSMGAATVMLAAARSDVANLMAVVEDCGYASAYNLFSQLVPVLTPYPATIMPVMDMMSSLMTGHALTEATPIEAIDEVTVPSMFIHGTADTLIAPSNADSLYAQSGAEIKTLYKVEGAGHGRSGIDANEEYGANLFQFLDNNDGSGVIYNYLADMSVGGTADGDSIVNVGTAATIDAGDGNDQITLGGSSWTVEGDQTLQSTGNNVIVDAGAGDDAIRSRHSYWTTLLGGDGNDAITVSDGHYMNIDAGAGDDSIIGTRASWGMGGHATISGGDGNDYIRAGYSNDSSINGGAGNDTIAVDGPNVTIRSGGGADFVSLNSDIERTPQGSTANVIIVDGTLTVDGFDSDDVIIFEDARRDKWVEFTDDGLLFRTDTIISPDVMPEKVVLSGITSTSLLQFRYGIDADIETEVFIKDGDVYQATLGTADNYVGFANAGIDFGGFTDPIDIQLDSTLGSAYFGGIAYVKGGDGITNIVGTAKDETLEIGAGSTTVNGGGGNDRIIGLKDGDYIIIDQNIVGSSVSGNSLLLGTDDGTITLAGDSLRGGNSIMIAKGHTIVGDSGLEGIYASDDGATIVAPNGIATLDNYVYTIAGDADGISISGNSLVGFDPNATITFENGGEYYVNGGLVTIDAGGSLYETDLLSGDARTVNGGEWWFGANEYGTVIASDARTLIHSYSASLTVDPGANTTIDAHNGVTVVDYDPSDKSGFSFESGALGFGDGFISLGADNVIRGLAQNVAKLYGSGSSIKAAWTGSDGLLDRSSTTDKEMLFANVDNATVISGPKNDTIVDSGSNGLMIRFGDGRDTVVNFDGDDVLYQDAYSDKKFDFVDGGLKFYDNQSSMLLSGVEGAAAITWRFGSDETVNAVYIDDGYNYIVGADADVADQYIGQTRNTGVDFSAVDDDLNIDADLYNVEKIGRVTLGAGDSTFHGSTGAELITVGEGNANIVFSRGHDTIVGFRAAQDRLTVGSDFTVKVDGDNLIVGTGRAYKDKLVLDGAATLDEAIRIDDRTFAVGDQMTFGDGITDYVGSKNATLNIGGDANVWLNGVEGTNYTNIRTVDGSGSEGDMTIAGSARSDTLIGGAGNNSLWGGNGGNDLMIGGAGDNTFFYLLGDGNDTIRGAVEDDVISLLNIGLDEIKSIDATDNATAIRFADGGRLNIAGDIDLTYELSDGSYTLDRQNKTLQRK